MFNTFDTLVEERVKKIKETLTQKGKEYSTQEDRFHNFQVAAKMNETTPEKALYGMMLKHIVSVYDIVNSTEGDSSNLTDALIDEKIGDNINYLILLEGLLKQRVYRQQTATGGK